jgi:hypothetical protein
MDLFKALKDFLVTHCTENEQDVKHGNTFHMALLQEAVKDAASATQLLDQLPLAAQRMWTSAQRFRGTTELCSIINAAIRADDPELLKPAVTVIRGINQLCLARRCGSGFGGGGAAAESPPLEVKFPPGGTTYRGGLLPNDHLPFYSVGKQYRVPGFVASSFKEKVAKSFARRAYQSAAGKTPAVIFVVQVSPEGEEDDAELCQNANFITNTLVPGEDEYLFVPYSVFTVTKVEISPNPNYRNPHRIYIDASLDSLLEPEDLPLAPWY